MSTQVSFSKYHGTGNDFIIIDNRNGVVVPNAATFAKWCDRRFGIGADGVILVQTNEEGSFVMDYYNADGNIGSMCGNGGRCFTHYLAAQGLIDSEVEFVAYDGIHAASLDNGIVSLQMADVANVTDHGDHFVLDTGSPHYVAVVDNVDQMDVRKEGAAIRNTAPFAEEGINVNFLEEVDPSTIRIRTYERGVEDETFSCGTGVVASAIVHHITNKGGDQGNVKVLVRGGELMVRFSADTNFHDIYLEGSATHVYSGTISV